MSDPFDPLRDLEANVRPPSMESIRRRVRHRQRRRQGVLGGAAGLVAVLAVLAIVTIPGQDERSRLATGDTPRPEQASLPSSPPTGTAGSAPEGAADRASSREGAGALEIAVDVPDEAVPPGKKAQFTLRVCNPQDDGVSVFFDDAQRYDFHVSRGGERVWTWSEGQLFAQVASSERWAAGACRTWTETWSGEDDAGRAASPGRYEVVGLLASDPEQGSPPDEFCMGACP